MIAPAQSALHSEVERYYTQRVRAHGASPRGVDWSCLPTQELRFVQLLKVCDFSTPFSLNDIGCGYGALLSFLGKRHRRARVDYMGVDLSPAMIEIATCGWRRHRRHQFAIAPGATRIADYSVASGIFNVKLSRGRREWERLIARTLLDMHAHSRLGFAVNFLATGGLDVPELYCTPARPWVRFCEALGARVEVLDQYGLRETTLLVRPALRP